LKTTHQCL